MLSYESLLSALHNLYIAGRTGTMFIGTNDNHSARFTLKNGEIIACSYGDKRGQRALSDIREISSGKYSFSKVMFDTDTVNDLPHTEEVLSYLGVTPSHVTEAIDEPQGEETPTPGTGKDQDAVPITVAQYEVQVLSIPSADNLMEILQTQLAMFIGPLGPPVCAMHANEVREVDSVERLSAVIERVAGEVGDPNQTKQFQMRVWEQLI